MIHPAARLILLLGMIIIALLTNHPTELLPFAGVLVIGHLVTNLWKPILIFVATVIIPLSVSLLVIEAAQIGSTFLTEPFWVRPSLLILRLLIIGSAIQLCMLPLIHRGVLLPALRDLLLPPSFAVLITSAVNAFEDMGRSAGLAVDAIKARGLATPTALWAIRELPGITVAMFTQSLRAAFQRAEMWDHRGVDPRRLASVARPAWSASRSVLLVIAFSSSLVAIFLPRGLP